LSCRPHFPILCKA